MSGSRPHWLTAKAPFGAEYEEVSRLVESARLHTVCQSAHCPNIGECWRARTATFMILGDTCTRNCRFCAVSHNRPEAVDPDEPRRVADAVAYLDLKHAVITSVTRDDLPDGGASVFAETVRLVHENVPGCTVEVLIPDFQGNWDALGQVIDAGPEILNHNIETVESLYPEVRPQAVYARSLELLRLAKERSVSSGEGGRYDTSQTIRPRNTSSSNPTSEVRNSNDYSALQGSETHSFPSYEGVNRGGLLKTKSGLMVGLGETWDEIICTMRNLREVGCDILTIGQYLAPSKKHAPIKRYYTPQEFDELRQVALSLGFGYVVSGPLVRSSYRARMVES